MEERKTVLIFLSIIFGVIVTRLIPEFVNRVLGFTETINLVIVSSIIWLIMTFYAWIGDATERG